MKKIILLCLFSLSLCNVGAQKILKSFPFYIDGTFKKDYEEYKAGTPLKFNQLVLTERGANSEETLKAAVVVDNTQFAIPYSMLKVMDLNPTDNKSFWEYKALQNDIYEKIWDKGYQYDIRQDLNDEATEYIKNLSSSNLFYDDPYTEDYVNGLFASVIYNNFNDKRLGTLNVYILKAPAPDSFILPNGSLVLSTGLLSTLDSEEELTAIMASEVAHFVLDHAIINVNKEVAREKRAAFWGGVVGGVLAAGEEYLMSKSEYYIPGTATAAVALISSAIFDKTSQRLGMTYSRDQEKVADQCAIDFLKMKNMQPSALASGLTKIKNYYEEHRDYYTLSKYGPYAEFDKRIERLGENKECTINHRYNKIMSTVNTFNSILMLNGKRYDDAALLVNKNIKSKVASDDDYVLLAKTNMALYNTEEKNNESLSLILKAKSVTDVPNLNTDKQEILALLRLNKQGKAASSLKEYIDHLSAFLDQTRSADESTWASTELNWANKLLQRISIL